MTARVREIDDDNEEAIAARGGDFDEDEPIGVVDDEYEDEEEYDGVAATLGRALSGDRDADELTAARRSNAATDIWWGYHERSQISATVPTCPTWQSIGSYNARELDES